MDSSHYTVELGPRQGNSLQDVVLRNDGQVAFRTTHREVLCAFVTRFAATSPPRPSGAASRGGKATTLTTTDILNSVDEWARRVERKDADATEHCDDCLPRDPKRTGGDAAEYLCVFHRDELKDRFGRYTVSQPSTICSAYAVQTGTFTQFVLHNIQPTSIRPAAEGVFVHGYRQTSRYGSPQPLELQGRLYYPATDVWWMASPLVVKPVYVLVETELAGGASLVTTATHATSPLASPSRSPHRSEVSGAGGAHSTWEDVSLSQGLSQPVLAPPRSSTPVPPPQPTSTHLNAVANTPKVVTLACTAVAQFRAPSAEASACSLVLIRTGEEELGLAQVTAHHEMDVLTWAGVSQRLRLPELAHSPDSALSLTVSPHHSSGEQVLFLYDAHCATTYILSTSHPLTRAGAFTLLFTLHGASCPVLLRCARPQTPQPVLVCNFPTEGSTTLYDPARLLQVRYPQADGRIATYPVAQRLVGCWKDVPTHIDQATARGGATVQFACHSRTPTTVPASTSVPAELSAGGGDRQRSGSLWTPEKADANAATPKGDREPAGGVPVLAEGTGNAVHPCAASTWSGTITFPSLQTEQHPLLHLILDALDITLGREHVSVLEMELLRQAFKADCEHTQLVFIDALGLLLERLTHDAVLRWRKSLPFTSGATDAAPSSATPPRPQHTRQPLESRLRETRLAGCFSDPLQLRAKAVDTLCTPMCTDSGEKEAAAIPCNGLPASTTKEGTQEEEEGGWSLTDAGLCTVTLHLLVESCKLQERLWPQLSTLAVLVWRLSRILGWSQYTALYAAAVAAEQHDTVLPARSRPHEQRGGEHDAVPVGSPHCVPSFSQALPESVLRQHFTFYHPQSDFSSALPPPLGCVEDGAAGGSSSSTAPPAAAPRSGTESVGRTPESLAVASFCAGSPPLLYPILGRLLQRDGKRCAWPLLQHLPRSHPISLANRLCCLYVDCFHPSSTALLVQPWWQAVCRGLVKYAIASQFVRRELCIGAAYPILQALARGREEPGADWDDALLAVVGRLDCVRAPALLSRLADPARDVLRAAEKRAVGRQYRATLTDDDGVIMRPDFPKTWPDSRLDFVLVLFNTAAPISLPAQSDHSEDLHPLLKTRGLRAQALPIGRGMLTMCTQNFRVRDSIPIPPLNLDGRTVDGISVTMSDEDVKLEQLMWPKFHNGCAAGLRFLPLLSTPGNGDDSTTPSPAGGSGESLITCHWMVYQTRNIQCAASRAGLLFAAGILGHLKVLQLTDIYSLLVSPQTPYMYREATTMAVMLGLSCSFRGTNNDLVFRTLSMHILSLTPSAEDIEVSLDVQTAALVSIGLLCQQTPTNTFLVEMLLIEMSRLPSDEHCVNREGYALGAGFGLGLLLLGLGHSHGVAEVEDRLLSFMEGGPREPVPSAREGLNSFNELNTDAGHFLTRALLTQNVQESSRCTCTRVYEGDYYNVGVSGPAAATALGLMYLKTEDAAMARRLAPPNRHSGLQAVTPSMCLLRSVMSALVVWSSIAPTAEWVRENVPSCLLLLLTKPPAAFGLARQQANYLLMNLGHCIAGTTLALGLRFAGSMDADAATVALAELQGFMKGYIGSTKVAIPTLQRSTGAYEACVSSCAVAVGLIMAGSGDLRCFALLRQLHRSSNVGYGVRMAVSMAIGLLFLGGGRMTLSTSTASIAALLVAVYPEWPRNPEDNVHHLQALRHLYGLSVVPRVLETVDALSNQPVSVPVRVILKQGRVRHGSHPRQQSVNQLWTPVPRGKEEQEVRLTSPCLYPPVEMIERIEVRSTHHYPVTLFQGTGQVSERGLVVRLLEKSGSRENVGVHGVGDCVGAAPTTATPVTDVHDAEAEASSSAARLRDWLYRLFRQQSTTVMESVSMVDSMKLLQVSQRAIKTEPVTANASSLLSPDFGKAVEQTLERRYRYLFAHGPPSTVSDHPLYALIMQQQPLEVVVRRIASHPRGSPGFPCDFTALELHSPPPRATTEGGEQAGSGTASEEKTAAAAPSTRMDLHGLERWIAEAVHYYDLDCNAQKIRTVLTSEENNLRHPGKRVIALLRMSRQLLLPLATVERLAVCCVGEPAPRQP